MADLLPNHEATDPHARAGNPQDRSDTSKYTNNGAGKLGIAPCLDPVLMLTSTPKGAHGKLITSVLGPTSPKTHSNDAPNGYGSDGRVSSEGAIDPLSQVRIDMGPYRLNSRGLRCNLQTANTQEDEYVSRHTEVAGSRHRSVHIAVATRSNTGQEA